MKNCKSILLTVISLVIISCEQKMPELNIGVPTMGEVKVTDNGSLVFELQGSLTSYENLVSECGFCIGTDASMEGAAKHPCKLTGKSFSTTLTLEGYNRKYYVCSYITNGRAELLSEKKTINIGPLDSYVSFGSIVVESYDGETETAQLTASCTVKDAVDTGSYGILYGTSSDLLKSGTKQAVQFPSGDESARFTITGLKIGTQYHICQYLTDNGTTVYGKTVPLNVYALPKVSIGDISDITSSTAIVSGKLTDEGGAVILEKGVVYAEGGVTPTVETGKVQSSSINQDIAVTLRNLAPNRQYTVRAYATNSQGTAYSTQKIFTTLLALPEVTTESATSISSNSAVLNASIANDGGETPSECGFYWSAEQFSDISSATKVIARQVESSFYAKIDGLTRITTYYYLPYVRNSVGTAFGDLKSFSTTEELPTVTTVAVTFVSDTEVTSGGAVTDDGGASVTKRGVVWSTAPNPTVSLSTKTENGFGTGSYTSTISGLSLGTTYYLRAYATNSKGTAYGMERQFKTPVRLPKVVTESATSVNPTSAVLNARLTSDGGETPSECGFYWSSKTFSDPSFASKITAVLSGDSFSAELANLSKTTTYYYQAYAINSIGITYGEQMQLTTPIMNGKYLEPANCHIVSSSGEYYYSAVKGNSNESVGSISSCEVLWESFGTATTPSKGDLIKSVSYSDGYIAFETASTYKEGNAVIAAKDASGNILWSWHIWFTDKPQGQTYNNGAGVMMDRNLGATSATKGDVGALGLLYQWGRKDPFLNSSSISDDIVAKSTITWPSTVSSSSSTGTISYATSHPTTFIKYNSNNYDWYYTTSSSTDNTRWQSSKTIHDPCPAGWRVPDGGSNGVWSKAFGTSSSWTTSWNWDSSNKGMDFSKTDKKLGSSGPIWYPASGYRHYSSGALYDVGSDGYYWSVSPKGYYASYLYFSYNGYVGPAHNNDRAYGRSVRCLQE